MGPATFKEEYLLSDKIGIGLICTYANSSIKNNEDVEVKDKYGNLQSYYV